MTLSGTASVDFGSQISLDNWRDSMDSAPSDGQLTERGVPRQPEASSTPRLSFIETSFPALAISRVISADRRVHDPAYVAHRWWARRPPSLMRAILLAAVMEDGTTQREFWDSFGSPGTSLSGISVHDPFMGGGTTLVEASRLGASVSGTDVDPTAQMMVAHALDPAKESDVQEAGNALLEYLRDHFSVLYPDDGGEQLHSFWLAIVTCPKCGLAGPLYRSLVLARDCGKGGAVVRDDGATAFDPDTFELRYLQSPTQDRFAGAEREWHVSHATFEAAKYGCPGCGQRCSHRELQTGAAIRQLIAIERSPIGKRRKLMPPSDQDLEALDIADRMLADPPVPLKIPDGEFSATRRDARPRSFGIVAIRDLFTVRQLLVLGAAHAWVDCQEMPPAIDRAIRLALSNALLTNNRLCSYATDYGRLSPLYSIRGYSLPALPVELNPLHSRGGRGTIQQCVNRVVRSAGATVKRSIWNLDEANTEKKSQKLPRIAPKVDLRCCSAADASIESVIDLLTFDPPYFDYIDYEELAEPFRAWRPTVTVGGETLQSYISNGTQDFGQKLADCIRPALLARNNLFPIVFTYHSSKPEAWEAVGVALDSLNLSVTAMWPVRSDGHMGPQVRPGNCEWDVVIVCRPNVHTHPARIPVPSELWDPQCVDLDVGPADRANLELAHKIASSRFGKLADVAKKIDRSRGADGCFCKNKCN